MRSTILVVALAALASACGSSESGSGAEGAATARTEELPLRRGDVWEVDPDGPADAQMLAYLNGLHAFVRQGDALYTATTRITEVQENAGVLTAKLGGGIEARLENKDNQPLLTFSSGPSARLRAHQPPGDKP